MSISYEFKGIDHVQLAAPAGCEEAARSFYSELLGWKELEKPPALQQRGGVWFQCGQHEVHIGVQSDFIPATKAHPGFHVSGLDELRAYLLEHKLSIFDDNERSLEGVKRFFIHDPFGNRIEFLEYVLS